MSSLVHDLQIKACDPSSSTTELLRKALVISTKLNLTELPIWIKNELEGYKKAEELPSYRISQGELKCTNHLMSVPVMITNPEDQFIKNVYIFQGVSELEALINNNGTSVMMASTLNDSVSSLLSKGTGQDGVYKLSFSITNFIRVLEAVKTKILEWALALEKTGIIDSGFSFPTNDIIKAQNTPTVNISIDNVGNAQIQTNSNKSSQSICLENNIDIDKVNALIDNLDKYLPNIELSDENNSTVASEITAIKSAITSPEKYNRVKQSLLSIKTIMESVAGNVVASGLVYEIAKIIN